MATTFEDTDDLVAELALLRKNSGFIARRLGAAPMVDEVLRQHRDDSFERLKSRFVSAVHALPEADASLLEDVFGLTADTENVGLLHERRAIHAAKIQRGTDTVAAREGSALEQLASRLIRGTYAQSPLTVDVPEMHNGIIYEMTSTMIIVEDRKWKETWEHYRFIATFDEMDYLTISRSYDGIVTADPRGRFCVTTRPISHGVNDNFWHLDASRRDTEPMRRGQQYDIRFRIQPDATERQASVTVASRGFHERALLSSIRVRFLGERPSTIWRHQGISFIAVPGEASNTVSEELNDKNELVLRQRDVHGGLFSGFAWEWANSASAR